MDTVTIIDERDIQNAMNDINDAMWESVIEVYDTDAKLYGWYGGRVIAKEGMA